MNWRPWLNGLIGAIIAGVAGAVISAGADIIIGDAINWKKLGTVAVIAGLLAGAAYLKQSPLPPPEDTSKKLPGP